MPMTSAELARLEALEARIGAPDPNNADPLTTRVVKVQVAQDSIVAWKDNFELWFVERGILDAIVQDVLGKISRPQPSVGGDVQAQLAAYDIHVRPGVLAIGLEPDPNDSEPLQVGGRVPATILGVSNTQGTDAQNPGEVHKNSFVVADNDGGMRWRQYLQWTRTGKKRNTLNRPGSILALDSMGDLCKSTEPVGSSVDGGQTWYIRSAGQFVDFCTYQVGKTIRILKSVSGYAATDQQQL
jgi:hypothetical protein